MPQQDQRVSIMIDGEVFELDMDALNWGELEGMETFFGCSIEKVDLESARAVIYLAFLARKRVHPLTTLDDLRALPLGGITLLESDPNPHGVEDGAADTSGTQS